MYWKKQGKCGEKSLTITETINLFINEFVYRYIDKYKYYSIN